MNNTNWDLTFHDVIRAETSFLEYLKMAWSKEDRLIVGRHARQCCALLTEATMRFMQGEGTILIVDMPYRHGKTSIFAEAFPVWFLGLTKRLFLVESHSESRFIEHEQNNYLESPIQKLIWDGGYRSGRPGLLVVDDLIKRPSEANDKEFRDAVHLRYLAAMKHVGPDGLVVVVNTRWHEDDLIGRILAHQPDYKPSICGSKFFHASFPAHKADPDGWETLFPERFPADWYEQQRGNLGKHNAAALLDCNPLPEAESHHESKV